MTPTTAAERQVLNELATGEDIVVGDKVPPATAGPDLQLRASFLRWLLTAGPGAPDLHAKGLRIRGALVTGDGTGAGTRGLDLEGCTLATDLILAYCRLPNSLLLRGGRVRNLYLNRSHLADIEADGLQAEGDVFLRQARVEGAVRLHGARLGGGLDCDGATLRLPQGNALVAYGLKAKGNVFLRQAQVEGTVRLLGARLGGDLDCTGATLRLPEGDALSADRLQAEGGVFFSEAQVEGTVRLPGARLGTILSCNGATLRVPEGDALVADGLQAEGSVFLRQAQVEGTVRLLGARFGGALACEDATFRRLEGEALVASTAEVGGFLLWHGDMTVEGAVILSAASFRAISDQRACWPKAGELSLDRCSYGAFVGDSVPVSAEARIEWLCRQYAEGDGQEFRPQPWEQCAKVLRDMGHAEDAREILIDKERRLRADRLRPERTPSPLRRSWLRAGDRLLDETIRFGHRPIRAARWAFLSWALGAGVFLAVDLWDGMMPNNAFIIRAPEWVRCSAPMGEDVTLSLPSSSAAEGIKTTGLREGDERTVDCFHRQVEGADYPHFEPISYAADTLLPVVDLHQQEYWTPNRKSWAGWAGRGYLWLHIALGWALSLLAVAGFSGLVKSD